MPKGGGGVQRGLDIYRFYFFKVEQDVTMRSCIPCLKKQTQ